MFNIKSAESAWRKHKGQEANTSIFSDEVYVFCERDIRFLWGSHARYDDPDKGAVMDTVWDKYFDTSEKYEKLREIKRRVDPNYIFTANSFGVDATNAPKDKNQSILGKDHD